VRRSDPRRPVVEAAERRSGDTAIDDVVRQLENKKP